MNDIVNSSNILKFILFADDTNLFHSGINLMQITTTMNQELKKLSQWFCANKLSLNVKKNTFIMFGTKNCEQSIPILLNGNVLDRVKSVKFLGVMLDE